MIQQQKNQNYKMSNKESDISSLQSVNIEQSAKVSSDAKNQMESDTKENDKLINDSKSNFSIKILLPFGLPKISLGMPSSINNILGGLVSSVASIVLAKIATAIFEKIAIKLGIFSNGEGISYGSGIDGKAVSPLGDIDTSEINTELLNQFLKEIDVNKMVDEAQLEYQNKTEPIKLQASDDIDNDKVSDVYSKPNNKKNKTSKYTIDKRNRTDILNSNTVANRKSNGNKNIKTINNPNYGTYYD
jgi:hypothetical protein